MYTRCRICRGRRWMSREFLSSMGMGEGGLWDRRGGFLLIRGRVMGLLAEWWCVFAWMGVVWIWGLRDWLIGGCRCDIS